MRSRKTSKTPPPQKMPQKSQSPRRQSLLPRVGRRQRRKRTQKRTRRNPQKSLGRVAVAVKKWKKMMLKKATPRTKRKLTKKRKRMKRSELKTFTFKDKCKITKKDTALSALIYPCLSDHFKKQTSEARTQLTRNSAFSSLKKYVSSVHEGFRLERLQCFYFQYFNAALPKCNTVIWAWFFMFLVRMASNRFMKQLDGSI